MSAFSTSSTSKSGHRSIKPRPFAPRGTFVRYGACLALVALCVHPPHAGAGERKDGTLKVPQKSVETEELSITVSDAEVYCIAAGPKNGNPILLMHGARFSSQTWLRTNTIQDLASAGYRVFAIDIPGFAKSPKATVYAKTFTKDLLSQLTKKPALLVTPSLSGRFVFPPAIELSPQIAGWVAVAPAGMDFHKDDLDKIKLPTLVLWGSKDGVFPVAQADVLVAAIAGSKKVVFEGANHPCYLNEPERFNKEIIDFAASIFRDKKKG